VFTVLLYNYLFFNLLNQKIMKKILLLCSIIGCCMGTYAQITLVPSASTVTSGTVITFTAVGENPSCYLTSFYASSIDPNGNDLRLKYVSNRPYAPSTNMPTQFNVIFYNLTSTSISKIYTISWNVNCNLSNSFGTSTSLTIIPGWYKNVKKCITFTRNNCPAGQQGTTGSYCVSENTYTSTISQEDADNKAQEEIDNNTSQALANQILSCKTIFSNVAISTAFTRNNCTVGSVGSSVMYVVPAGKYTSTLSQADANAKAQAEVTANGQTNANNLGVCTFFNGTLTVPFTKNNCPAGQVGSVVTYTVPANKYSSTVSQADANAKALAEVNANGQANANSLGGCEPTFKINAGCTGVTQSGFSLIVSGLTAGQTVEIPGSSNFNITSNTGGTLRASFFIAGAGGTSELEILVKQNGNIVLTKNVPVTIPTGGRACP
jgi:hypothetical protein